VTQVLGTAFPMARDPAMRRAARISRHVTAAPVAATGVRRFEGQVCVVTGAARGLGRSIAERFATEGARAVCILDVLDATEAVAAVKKLAPEVGTLAVQADLTQEAEASAAAAAVIEKFGQIDVLVQAAGITGKTNLKTHEVDLADFQRVFDVNVKAIFLVAKATLPSMLKSGYGRIVNIASISGKDGNAGMLAYSCTKAAVINLTKVMGKDYVDLGKDITVNCVSPAVVRTDMVDAMPPEQVKYMTSKIPMNRCGEKDEVASTVLFAASKECSFTTGFSFDCTGGRAVY